MVGVFVAFIRVVHGRMIYMSLPNPTRLFTCKPCRAESDVSPQVAFSRGFGPGTICLYYFAHISHFPKT